jgi:PKD repeat protein
MPDGSIILAGGSSGSVRNDVWRSTDKGATWIQLDTAAEWNARYGAPMVSLPNGSVVIIGGNGAGLKNDTWYMQPAGSSSQNPSHTFVSEGTFSVSLTAMNIDGRNTKIITNYITVSAPLLAPVAGFSGAPTSGTVPLSVQFTDASTGLVTSYKWDFGDGTNSTMRSPLHTYTAVGRYTVKLIVSNGVGSNTLTKKNYITAS